MVCLLYFFLFPLRKSEFFPIQQEAKAKHHVGFSTKSERRRAMSATPLIA
jgi:hypothetical protein